MNMRLTLTLLGLTLSAACQRSGEAPAPPAPAPAPEAAQKQEALLRVEAHADGTLKLIALDKWGASIDTTYENITYLENAVPTLERGLTPEQTAKLKAELQRLKAGK